MALIYQNETVVYSFGPRDRKHLKGNNTEASVFFNRSLMNDSIQKCLNKPDLKSDRGKRFELIKTFSSGIGVMGYTNRTSNTVKLVCKRTKKLDLCHYRLSDIATTNLQTRVDKNCPISVRLKRTNRI